jgi:hypothetical protein
MYALNSPMDSRRTWLVWLCLVLFTSASIAESAHFHPDSAAAEQHCSLCIAAHSVARPAPAVNPVAAPTQCISLLIVSRPSIPDPSPLLSAYIRPPPAA